MPFPAPTASSPPQYVLDELAKSGFQWDANRYAWDGRNIIDRQTGAQYDQGNIADPSLGSTVVTNLSSFNANGPTADNSLHFDNTPFFGFPDGGPMFVSDDPAQIQEYKDSARDRAYRGIAQVGALVGGAAALGATPWGSSAPGATGAASAGSTAATTYPLATGGPIAVSPLTGGAGGAAAGTAAAAGGNVLSNAPSWVGNYLIPGLNAALGYNAADSAADAQANAANAAIAENRRQYDTTRNDLMPWLDAGRTALGQLQDPNAFMASPGYEWQRNEGQRDIGNSFAARGGAASGNALRALTEFNSGLAAQDYNNWFNRTAGIAGVGQNTAVNLGGLGANSSAQTGRYMTDAGTARASGVLGKYGAAAGGLNDAFYNMLYRRA